MAKVCLCGLGPVSMRGFEPQLIRRRDYYLKSEAERRLVRKLDTYMLVALCFGWLMKACTRHRHC